MPQPTYTPLATVTLGASASSVTFSSIPATYRDLILVVNAIDSDTALLGLRFNGITTGYSRVFMFGSGSTTSSSVQTDEFVGGASTGGTLNIIQLMDYSATDKHKTSLTRYGNTTGGVIAQAGRWADTSAITSVLVNLTSGTFTSGATFNLYGVIA